MPRASCFPCSACSRTASSLKRGFVYKCIKDEVMTENPFMGNHFFLFCFVLSECTQIHRGLRLGVHGNKFEYATLFLHACCPCVLCAGVPCGHRPHAPRAGPAGAGGRVPGGLLQRFQAPRLSVCEHAHPVCALRVCTSVHVLGFCERPHRGCALMCWWLPTPVGDLFPYLYAHVCLSVSVRTRVPR